MPPIFAGKQPGQPDPVAVEGTRKSCGFTVEFKGIQAGQSAPTVSGCMTPLSKLERR